MTASGDDILLCDACHEYACVCPDGHGWLTDDISELHKVASAVASAIAAKEQSQYEKPLGPYPRRPPSDPDAPTKTFLDDHRDFQEVLRELQHVRNGNLKHDKWTPNFLAFCEGLLVILAIERFLRAILGSLANDQDTLCPLLEKATSKKVQRLTLPTWWPRDQTIKAMGTVRNAIMHGNFQQAARANGMTVHEYFKSSAYLDEMNTLYRILTGFVNQIDPQTGCPKEPREPWFDRDGFVLPEFKPGCSLQVLRSMRRYGQFDFRIVDNSGSVLVEGLGLDPQETMNAVARVVPANVFLDIEGDLRGLVDKA